MHDHDLDLIAEHASGLLTGADESRATELVGTCEACAREFADHTRIRTLLAAAPAPSLSEFERTRLRRSVLDTVAPPTPAVAPRQRLFLAAAGAVAAVLVVVAGVGIVGQLGGGDDGFTLADGGDAVDTTASAEALVPFDQSAGDEAETLMADEDAERHVEEAADDAGLAAAAAPQLMVEVGEIDGAVLDSVLGELSAAVMDASEPLVVEEAVRFGASCAPAVEGEILGLVLASVDGVPTQVFLLGDRAEPTVLMLVAPDCAAPVP
jgi:hypothetical protein